MAPRKVTINPVSRVEGHGKVSLYLDENGEVKEGRFHITQFRGFEVFTRGRPYEEMPIITQRICGICPVSHQLASAKACDAIMGQKIPKTARLLRELLHMGQVIQSHALHFFYLASPDLLLGWDSDPALRNVAGVIGSFPEAAVKGIRLRKYGQEIIKALGGKKVHPPYSIPGGVIGPLLPRERDRLHSGLKEARETACLGIGLIRDWMAKNEEEVKRFGRFDSYYLGLVDASGNMNLYDGKLRMTGPDGKTAVEFSPETYQKYIGEKTEPWSYMKFPYFKNAGYPDGIYRVGPLARLIAADGLDTEKAARELDNLRQLTDNGCAGGSLLYHYARLIEALYAIEHAQRLFEDPAICGTDVKFTARPKNREGIGVIEAPRGTLIHHYIVDENGAIEWANLIVATGHNNMAMNRAVFEVAREYIHEGQVREGILNRVEGAIRCYDPCLSCATHAYGHMPIRLQIYESDGNLRHEHVRG